MPEDSKTEELILIEKLFKQHYHLLVAKSYQICGSWQIAEDAVQEFFADVWEKKRWETIATTFASYAVQGIKFKTISLLRKSGTLLQKQDSFKNFAESHQESILIETEEMEEKLTREIKLVEALNSLPPQRKEAFILAHYYDHTYEEISTKMRVSKNTVKTHLRLAMCQLRDMLVSFLFFLIFF